MWTRLAHPGHFLRWTQPVMPWLAGLSGLLLGVGLYLTWFVVPPDYQQGETVRIMYIHVPAAWLGVFFYGSMVLSAIGTLVWRHPLADVAQRAAAPIGAAFTLICLVTGALWGKPMDGVLATVIHTTETADSAFARGADAPTKAWIKRGLGYPTYNLMHGRSGKVVVNTAGVGAQAGTGSWPTHVCPNPGVERDMANFTTLGISMDANESQYPVTTAQLRTLIRLLVAIDKEWGATLPTIMHAEWAWERTTAPCAMARTTASLTAPCAVAPTPVCSVSPTPVRSRRLPASRITRRSFLPVATRVPTKAISSGGSRRSTRRARRSKRTRSPVFSRARPPPTAASGETWPATKP